MRGGRRVKLDSKCSRYWYFRERYLEKQRIRGKTHALSPDEAMTEAQWRAAKRPPSRITWIELSTGRSNS